MGKLTTYICDHCGKQSKFAYEISEWHIVNSNSNTNIGVSQYLDLCENCSKQFNTFLTDAVESFKEVQE